MVETQNVPFLSYLWRLKGFKARPSFLLALEIIFASTLH
jgi:hypothetical protein